MKFFLMTVAMISLSAMALADDNEAPTGTGALLCRLSQHGRTTTETLSLDYDQKLVNGVPADFSNPMITWTVHNGTASERHELNRLTGTYNYWTEGSNPAEGMPTFICTKAIGKF